MASTSTGVAAASEQDGQTCQRCRQPLLLDPSIQSLTPAQHSLITSALPAPSPPSSLPPSAKLASLPPSSNEAAQIWATANHLTPPRAGVAESFVLLSDSVLPTSSPAGPSRSPVPSLPPAGSQLAENLHSLLSSRTPIDHPLCTECTTLLQSELQKELEELSRERDAYIAFERGILRNRENLRADRNKAEDGSLGEYDIEGTEDEWAALIRRKKDLEAEETALRKRLEEREKEVAAVKVGDERARKEEEDISEAEEAFLLSHAALSSEYGRKKHALQTAKTHHLLAESLLRHLESANVWNDAFHIGHVPLVASGEGGGSATASGSASSRSSTGSSITVGTINGLRLGGRPTVGWEEINAAWGLVALCVDRIAVKIGYNFESYKIVPMGSFSRIEDLPPGKQSYDLYVSADISSRLLQNRRFSNGLVALLDCIKQLIDFGRKTDRGWAEGGPEIHKDRISNHSIRLPGIASAMPALPSMSVMGFGTSSTSAKDTKDRNDRDAGTGEEQWTRACRAVLAVLKRMLVVESEADRAKIIASAPTR
ncbi:autophagy protein 6 [Saitozyma podzolica]|uniref:Autophagy protein 6 n=1 Tax=Saitozyma podzolica TaxID=1890683 RepID=A0A427YP74_9TREE|nr:autophagy protein 6 [Saitozyma podzolica]